MCSLRVLEQVSLTPWALRQQVLNHGGAVQ